MEDREYTVPSNVKRGITWLGLDFNGWIYFLLTFSVFGGLSLLIPILKVRVTIILASILIGHWCYQIDEKTGAMNGAIVADVVRWLLSPKLERPMWGGGEHETRVVQVEE